MSAGNIRAGQAFVELSIRDKLHQGLRAAHGKLQAFAAGVRMIGTAMAGLGSIGVVAGIVGMVKSFSNVGSELHDMSLRTGVATDNLSELKFAAEQTGTTLEAVEKALRFMAKQGIDVKQFDKVLKAVSEIADESERAAAAQKIFGRGGTALLAMAKELPELRAQARMLGVSMSPERAALADDLGDAGGRLKAALSGLTMQLGAAMAPALIGVLNAATVAAAGLGHFTATLGAAANQIKATPEVIAAALLGVAKGLSPALALTGIFDKLQPGLAKGLRAAGQFPKFTMPDLLGMESALDMKAGNTSRGQFGGFRAESLGVGSGGGTEKKLTEIKGVMDKMLKGILDNVKATKEIDGEEFS